MDAICNVVSILPANFATSADTVEEEEFLDEDEGPVVIHDVMPFDSKNAAVFPRPTESMKTHLKPLFIKAKAEGKIIKRVLIDGGAAINLISEHVVQKLNKTCSDVIPRNMVITDFNGRTTKSP